MALPLVHETPRDRLVHFLFPSALVWMVYFIAGSLLLFLLNIHPFWQFLSNRIFGATEVQNADYSLITDPVFNFINQHDTPVLLLLWGLIGCFVFSMVLIIQRVVGTARQEVKESHDLIGGVQPNVGYWRSIVRLDLLFVALGICWTIYIVLYFSGILPWASHLLFVGLNSSWTGSYKILESLLADTLALYLFIKITYLLTNSWHEIRPRL